MKWTHALIAGSAIILLTNAVVLGGAVYNRSGEAESQLSLTQRELNRSIAYSKNDNSGIELSLNWRIEQATQNEYSDSGMYLERYGTPIWLDKAKMAALGFDVERLADVAEYGRSKLQAQSKEVLLVLESNGPAYRRQLQRSEEYFAQAEKLLEAAPDNGELKSKAKNAKRIFNNEQLHSSRLYVVDAGLDLQALRAAYPDRAHHAIVHGLMIPSTVRERNEILVGGNITQLYAGRINVPFAYRQVFGDMVACEVTVAFGKRLEPWIVAASKGIAMKQTEENK